VKHLATPIVSFGPIALLRAVRNHVRKELAWGRAAAQLLARLRQWEAPVTMPLSCPGCNAQHVDRLDPKTGIDWATRPHAEHLCERCGLLFTPYPFPTAGIADSGACKT
jgi:hypothetical protein